MLYMYYGTKIVEGLVQKGKIYGVSSISYLALYICFRRLVQTGCAGPLMLLLYLVGQLTNLKNGISAVVVAGVERD
jgi:hypothetical protein